MLLHPMKRELRKTLDSFPTLFVPALGWMCSRDQYTQI